MTINLANYYNTNYINAINNFDLVLFLEPDVEFVQDGTRTEEIKKNREKYSNQIKSIFDEKIY